MLTQPKSYNLKDAATYCGLTEPQFRHIFYNVNQKQKPVPKYLGKSQTVKKNLNGIDREFEVQTILRFTDKALDDFLYGGNE
tara:strand:- start:30 stop:275 length:246 start_codon:yes stop_codon:yes gene_type:complete